MTVSELFENGRATLSCTKDGKALKSVPAKLKKNGAVIALADTVKALTEQYKRTRVMLERAMEDGTVGIALGIQRIKIS